MNVNDRMIENVNVSYGYNPMILCDFYKIAHRICYKEGTESIYSMLVGRNNKYLPVADKIVAFGFLKFTKEYLIEYFNTNFFNRDKKEIVDEYVLIVGLSLDIPFEKVDTSHIEELHDLGYLPLRVSAVKEGTLVPFQVPVLVVENTLPSFFWLTNYIETLMSAELWHSMTSATKARSIRQVMDEYALKTTGSTDAVDFLGHDFSMRGMSGLYSGINSGMAHLLFYKGTDTIPAIQGHMKYYNADIRKEFIGGSINAMEHSVMSSLTPADGDRDEYGAFKHIITKAYPEGLVSIVSDTYDFDRVISETLPRLKNEIMSRNGKVVIRPDSGDPVEILCGKRFIDLSDDLYVKTLDDIKEYFHDEIREDERTECGDGFSGDESISYDVKYDNKYYKVTYEVEYNRHDKRYYYVDTVSFKSLKEVFPTTSELGLVESLWNTFGGEVNDLGYKVLDSHIGVIYGDSMNYERISTICRRLEEKGFASTNFVSGVGSYFYTGSVTRDSLGFAIKATHSVVNGKDVKLFKDPKTDVGKRSLKGRAVVYELDGEIVCKDNLTRDEEVQFIKENNIENLLLPLFENGKILREDSLKDIRLRVKGN